MPSVVCNGKTVELVRATIPEPEKCPFCGTKTQRNQTLNGEGAITMCPNPECPVKQDRKLRTWFSKVEILGVGDSVREALQTQMGVYTPADIYRLGREISVEELRAMVISGENQFGGNADHLVEEIDKKRELPLNIFLGSLGIDGLGRREVEIACQKVPGELDTLADWRSGKLRDSAFRDRLNAQNKAQKWADGIDGVASIIDGLIKNGVKCVDIKPSEEPEVVASGSALSGLVMVFTGAIQRTGADGKRFTRDMMHAKARENGAEIDDKIKKSTPGRKYTLVQADANSVSSKTKDAQAKGADIISEAAFWGLIGE